MSRSLQTNTLSSLQKYILCGTCQRARGRGDCSCCVFCAFASGESVHQSESFQTLRWKGLIWDPCCKNADKYLSPPTSATNTTTSPVENWNHFTYKRDQLSFPPLHHQKCGQIAWKKKKRRKKKSRVPQGIKAKEFPCVENIFNKPLSCQECWPKGEKYVNNVGYCHTKYGNIVTSELWCASGNT